MWIILTPEIAEVVSGEYGDCNSIIPTLLKNGNYALHISIYDYDVFAPAFAVLRQCPIVDNVEFIEKTNEDI